MILLFVRGACVPADALAYIAGERVFLSDLGTACLPAGSLPANARFFPFLYFDFCLFDWVFVIRARD